MKIYLFAALAAFALTLVAGKIFIPELKKLKAEQTILEYVEEHKSKNGTPTMGGLFFVFSAAVMFFIFGGAKGRIASVCVVIGVAYMIIGFLDDFIKIKFRRNEGLKPYQKIVFQVFIGAIAGVFAYKNGLTEFYLPFTDRTFDFGPGAIPLTAFIFIAVTNCVNLTDGLDGLASSSSIGFLIPFLALVYFQNAAAVPYLASDEYKAVFLLCVCLIGALTGFLAFNTYRACVFMGDTGSLSLGGFLASLALFTGNGLYIPLMGIIFVISGVSVILQVAHYKRTKKRIFLMAPFHHHLQHKGISESKISYIYMTVTLIIGLLATVNYF